ncbi:hypothetical protein BU25DRAFT_406868 [Macroventuria anomochaeta]|uniref:Uncharacterized protein n=1 Tax=Macroventuria anomochaeta TaxID=301207 RepID=A0ACB6SE90_9PLEO|nr:uncharacterized protein BU25DRAFT_406868 [Macroventuria anomochaeta]KAF2632313.1 hypothetical protein BU25DRAFT_406868 [Macroventuria anomochaeta]
MSDNYNSYNYSYHQQSSAQQYSSHQTAPASNTNAQLSRQYQQPPSAATNQSPYYLPCSGPSYSTSSTGYGTTQDCIWSGSGDSYRTTRDNDSRTAEVLRHMNFTSSHINAVAASRNAAMAPARTSQQYAGYSRRQVPYVDSSQSSHTVPPSTSYAPRPPAPIVQPPASSTPEPHTGSSTTVDPTAVYDPWPEYQRQQAIKDAKRAEKERKEEAPRKEKERIEDEERKQKEAEEEARQAQIAGSQPKTSAEKAQKQAAIPAAAPAEASAGGSELEAEIRAKVREFIGKDPELLARIWVEERGSKAPNKLPTVTIKPAPHSAVVPPAQVPTPPVANQRKKATPRESLSSPSAKAATSVQAQAVPARAPAATPLRIGGNTIWPPDMKLELAKAAAHYLATKNLDRPLEAGQILQMLNSNPSYIELCEQLEEMGFKLDRSIFAKSLLSAVPDVNSASRKTALQPVPPAATLKAPAPPAVMKHPAPPAVMKNPVVTPVAPSPRYAPAAASPMNRSPYPPFPDNDAMAAPSPIPVAEMIPIKPGLKPPANKEEAARKRNLSDLIDLTQLDDEDDMGLPMKRLNADSMYTYGSPHPHIDGAMEVDAVPVHNFPTASIPAPVMDEPTPRTVPMPASELRYRAIVEPLDKKKALRRNTYNPATIARNVLLACGRHPSERPLNQHLDVLKLHFPQISNESDLSTIKWSLIDPGNPPPGYFKDGVQALIEDADDEDDSENEDREREARRGSSSHATGGESVRVQALSEATNPFMKQKQRGRPPRHSLPNTTTPSTPNIQTSSANMSASAPRPSAAAGAGHSAFRSATEFGPDGKPLSKKKDRPVGWRKATHGSAATQQRPGLNGHTGKYEPQQPSTLRNVRTGEEPIRIDSRSPSVANRVPQYQSFKCKWRNCKAELHNLETLKKHVFKVHKKETLRHTLECLWDDCGKEVTSFEPMTNMSIERHTSHAFRTENAWHEHIQQNHFDPLAWEQGDGPADGLSGTED